MHHQEISKKSLSNHAPT
jgi:hypothetical protein